jgi:hypothetical protein
VNVGQHGTAFADEPEISASPRILQGLGQMRDGGIEVAIAERGHALGHEGM